MILFPEHPKELNLGHRRFRLIEPYRYEWEHEDIDHRITVFSGFEHDGASVPGILRGFIPPEPLDRAGLVHDWMHHWKGHLPDGSHEVLVDNYWVVVGRPWSQYDSDRLFGRMLREDPEGPRRWRRRAAYRAVRVWGWRHWRKGGWA